MVILDTDHMSLLEWTNSPSAQKLNERLEKLSDAEITTTIISFEEQTKGWLTILAKAKSVMDQIEAYRRLNRLLGIYAELNVLDFDENAAVEFQQLRKQLRRLNTMDLKIAAIAVSRQATLLTRNLADFSQIPGLQCEDWTK
jgi:tRNA(fMet)-specific endonuclease VapC